MAQSNQTYLAESYKKVTKKISEVKLRREQHLLSTKGRFNIFNILRLGNSENHHSRFILDLLNPEGSHDCGDKFLNCFLDIISEDFSLKNLQNIKGKKIKNARTEEPTDANRRIDIFLEFNGYIIAIENKIWALEQNDQISHYAEYIKSNIENRFLFYLTLNGKESYTHKGSTYFPISYEKHIFKWLDMCLKSSYQHININQSLQQYQSLIRQLTNQTLEQEDMDEIKNILIENPEIIKQHKEVAKAIDSLIKELRDKFFKNLFAKLKEFNIEVGDNNLWKHYYRYPITITGHAMVIFSLELDLNSNYLFIGLRDLNNEHKGRQESLAEKYNLNASKLNTIFKKHNENFPGDISNTWVSGTYHIYTGTFLSSNHIAEMTHDSFFNAEVEKTAKNISLYCRAIAPDVDNILLNKP